MRFDREGVQESLDLRSQKERFGERGVDLRSRQVDGNEGLPFGAFPERVFAGWQQFLVKAVGEPRHDLMVLDFDDVQLIHEFLVVQEQRQISFGPEGIENIVQFCLLPRRYRVLAGLEHPQILAALESQASLERKVALVDNAPLVDVYSHISPSME